MLDEHFPPIGNQPFVFVTQPSAFATAEYQTCYLAL